MCCRAVAWTASAAAEEPRDFRPHPRSQTPPQTPKIPVPHPSVFPKRTLASHSPPAPSSQDPLTSHLRASCRLRPATAPLHTVSVCRLCSLAAPSHQRHQISPACDVKWCFKSVPEDSAESSPSRRVTLPLHERMHWCTRSVSSLTPCWFLDIVYHSPKH